LRLAQPQLRRGNLHLEIIHAARRLWNGLVVLAHSGDVKLYGFPQQRLGLVLGVNGLDAPTSVAKAIPLT
jgi:hypothetical protein